MEVDHCPGAVGPPRRAFRLVGGGAALLGERISNLLQSLLRLADFQSPPVRVRTYARDSPEKKDEKKRPAGLTYPEIRLYSTVGPAMETGPDSAGEKQ